MPSPITRRSASDAGSARKGSNPETVATAADALLSFQFVEDDEDDVPSVSQKTRHPNPAHLCPCTYSYSDDVLPRGSCVLVCARDFPTGLLPKWWLYLCCTNMHHYSCKISQSCTWKRLRHVVPSVHAMTSSRGSCACRSSMMGFCCLQTAC